MLPLFAGAIADQGVAAKAVASENATLFIDYEPVARGSGYVEPTVQREFGARSTGEPAERRNIHCDAAASLTSLVFPEAQPRVMLAERTFWEKATAIHVYCKQGRFRGGDRFARHWYDLVRLDDAGISDRAMMDTRLAHDVARHKQIFFAEKDEAQLPIEYVQAVTGGLTLVPEGRAREALADDYARMVEDGLLLDDAIEFEPLMARCQTLVDRINAATSAAEPG